MASKSNAAFVEAIGWFSKEILKSRATMYLPFLSRLMNVFNTNPASVISAYPAITLMGSSGQHKLSHPEKHNLL
jgi:hypothetical protein